MNDPDTPAPAATASARYFYGWRVVAAVFVTLTISSGLGFYNVSVFLNALVRDAGYSVGTASLLTTEFFLVGAFAGLGVGRLIDRFDPRYTICSGAVIAAVGMLAIGHSSGMVQLVAAYVLFSVGFAASGLIPGTTVVARWFHRQRATALAVASSGLSLGGITLTPLSAHLIGQVGLASAMPWLAGLYVVGVVPIAALVLRPSPASLGLQPDGAPTPSGGTEAPQHGLTFRDALRTRFFWVMTAAFTLIMLAQVAGMAHEFNLAAERAGRNVAAFAVAVLSGSSLVGRLIGGWMLTRISIRRFMFALFAQQIAALLLLGVAHGALALIAVSMMFGLTIGNILMMLPLTLAEVFGVRDYGKLYSTAQVITQTGVSLGPFLVGMIHDQTGGYGAPMVTVAGVSLAGAFLLWRAGPFPRPEQHVV